MKLLIIFTLFALSVIVKGAWWAIAVQPVILSIGAVFAALDLDLQPILDVQPKLLIFKSDKEAAAKVTNEDKKKEDKDEK